MSPLIAIADDRKSAILLSNNLPALGAGDEFRMYHLNSLLSQGVAVLDGVPVESTDPAVRKAAAQAAQIMDAPPYNAHFVGNGKHVGKTPYVLQFTAPLPPTTAAAALSGSLPLAVTSQGAINTDGITGPAPFWTLGIFSKYANSGVEVVNSNFHDGYARVWLIKVRDGYFSNNRFARSGGIHIGPEQAWLEGDPGITNVSLVNNLLTECGVPAILVDPTVTGSVSLYNNTINPALESDIS
jgi:hypothetical protein